MLRLESLSEEALAALVRRTLSDSERGLGDRKLAACGLHLRRGVSIHGFSFNVCTPPSAWNCIVPCGLPGPGPISLAEAIKQLYDI